MKLNNNFGGGIIFSILVFLSNFSGISQNYANSWIDYSQTYYKFTSDRTGIHRISYEAMLGAGLNGSGSSLKLFSRGVQIPIFVSNEGPMQPGDFIEFFGQKNDGFFDEILYYEPSHQCNENISLFSDIIAYFLTSDPQGDHLRFQNTGNDITNPGPAESYFMYESIKNTNNIHNPGIPKTNVGESAIWLADFEKGEGFVGPIIQSVLPYALLIPTGSVYTGAGVDAEVSVKVVGRDDDMGAINDQVYSMSVNGQTYINGSLQSYNLKTEHFEIATSALSGVTTAINIEVYDGSETIGSDSFSYETKISTVYGKIRYPHSYDFEGKSSFIFEVQLASDKYFEITNFNGGNAPIIYDITATKRIIPIVQGGAYKFKLLYNASEGSTHKLIIANTESATSITQINSLTQRDFTDYGDIQNQGDFIIISHNSLRSGAIDWVRQYANYRQDFNATYTPGFPDTDNKYSQVSTFAQVVIADIDELYDQYAYGIPKNPMSIKNFINSAVNYQSPQQWDVLPSHCFIIGKGIKYPAFRYNPTYFPLCLVPTYGHQPSDNLLMSRDIFTYQPQLAVGRIPAQSPEEVRAYLSKMIRYEKAFKDAELYCDIAHRTWMKNTLFVDKGWGDEELEYLIAFSEDYLAYATGAPGGMHLVANLTDNCNHCNFPSPTLPGYIDDGLAFINFNGHSDGLYWQFDIHEPETYNNAGRYPFILSNSCFVGQIHETSNTSMSEEWVLAEDRGAICFIATLYIAYPALLDIFSNAFTHNLFVSHYGETAGSSVVQTISDIYNQDNVGIKTTCLEFTFNGDPSLKIYHFDQPEFLLDVAETISINPITVVPSVNNLINVNFEVYNTGRIHNGNLEVQINVRNPQSQIVHQQTLTMQAPDYSFMLSAEIPVSQNWYAGNYSIDILLDPQNLIVEDCDENNNNKQSMVFQVTANPCAAAIDNNIEPVYCANEGSFSLVSEIPGVFSIAGLGNISSLNPSAMGVGTHTVNFSFSDPGSSANCSTSYSFEVVPLPDAEFSPLSGIYCAGTPITLSFAAAYNPAYTYQWIVSPSTGYLLQSSDEQSYSITFTSDGNKQLSLQVTDDKGCTSFLSTATATFTITPAILSPEISGPSIACPGTDQTYEVSNENYDNLTWDIINGTIQSASGQAVVVNWAISSGEGTITAIGQNSQGCQAESYFLVGIEGVIPTAEFYVGSTEICPGQSLDLENHSENALAYNWNITHIESGEEWTTSGEYPDFPSLPSGTYQLLLIAYGCSDILFDEYLLDETITFISETPSISISPENPVQGQQILLDAHLTEGNFLWEGPGLLSTTGPQVAAVPDLLVNSYYLTYISPEGCEMIDSITISFTSGINSTTAFAHPVHNLLLVNEDLGGDYWNLSWLSEYPNHKVELYTRDGTLVFCASPYLQNFNGVVKGCALPAGTYVYVISPGNGKRERISGLLTIIR